MANRTAVTLLLGHFDRKINNLVKRVDTLEVSFVENLENTDSKSSETFSSNYLYKLFQGAWLARNTHQLSAWRRKDFFLSLLLLKHRKLKIGYLPRCVSASGTNKSFLFLKSLFKIWVLYWCVTLSKTQLDREGHTENLPSCGKFKLIPINKNQSNVTEKFFLINLYFQLTNSVWADLHPVFDFHKHLSDEVLLAWMLTESEYIQ